jgi:Predicted dehydrogenases and related proteins
MKIDIVIIGMGTMGKWHLKAAAGLDFVRRIICYDIKPQALHSVSEFCRLNSVKMSKIELFFDFKKTLKEVSAASIVIVSTTAKGKSAIMEKIINCRPRAVIAEKPLCQNISEYRRIMALSKKMKIQIYINFPRHAYPVYKAIAAKLKQEEDIMFSTCFPGGMACIGIHLFELMTWLARVKEYKFLYTDNRSIFSTKRRGYRDFTGEIALVTDKKNICLFKSIDGELPFVIRISTATQEIAIYEGFRKIIFIDKHRKIRQECFEIPWTSQIMGDVISDLVRNRKPVLPSVADCYVAHSVLFEYIRSNKLQNVNIT